MDLLIIVVLVVLALLGAPLFAIFAAAAMLLFFNLEDTSITGAAADIFSEKFAESPLLVTIPLFTFAGTLMSESNAPTRLINLCRAVLGWLPGGLALVTLVACCFFTAFTGASGVTIVALGGLLFPILLREKYPERFSLGLLTTGGSLGLLFPPSLPVIVYGLVARVDVGRLFQAALVPGILLVLFLAVTSFAVAITSKVPRHPFTFGELKSSLRAGLWELPLPFLVVGGIYSGIITAAEASAVTAAYVLLTTVVIYRDVGPKDLPEVVRKTAVLVGAILLIMGAALGFTDWLTLERIPQKILAAMQRHISGQLTFLITLNIFLLIVGCLMDIFSATLVVVPLIGPVAQEFGVDPKVVETMDTTYALAVAAGLQALENAGLIPAQSVGANGVAASRKLRHEHRDSTGVIFAASFPALDSMVDETARFMATRLEHEKSQVRPPPPPLPRGYLALPATPARAGCPAPRAACNPCPRRRLRALPP